MTGRIAAMVVGILCALASPATAQQDKPLDARQTQALKEAADYVSQAEAVVRAMEAKSAGWAVGDPAVPINEVAALLPEREKAVRYLNNCGPRFSRLPGRHPAVAAEIKRYDATAAALAAVQKKLVDVHAKLKAMPDAGKTPEYAADFDRLREIAQTYANPDDLRTAPARAADAAVQLPAAKAERDRIATKYAALLNQPTAEAKQMREVLAFADKLFPAYEKAVAEFTAAAPGEIAKAADDVLAAAREGVALKKPGYFGPDGGVRQKLAHADRHLAVLTAIAPDADGTKTARAKLDTTRAEIAQIETSFLDAIVAENRVPPDNYAGADRADLVKRLTDHWAADGNGAPALKIGVVGPEWRRDTRWVFNKSISAWEKVDKSRVQGYVVAKLSDTHAAVWPVNFTKDHLAGDKISAAYLTAPNAAPPVAYRLLLTNVK
ncbi:MAG TPA: hypothetical protein VEA69_21425 [Tepidisphaeraceae bacterium]|nr:hypothetical protein [Tepidisphaeraceae bacterium]